MLESDKVHTVYKTQLRQLKESLEEVLQHPSTFIPYHIIQELYSTIFEDENEEPFEWDEDECAEEYEEAEDILTLFK